MQVYLPRILDLYWYKYLFHKPWTWEKVWCRIQGHPNGPVWYSVYLLEPDMKCKDCGDIIGG